MATRLDEGLEDFFSRRVMDESSRYEAHSPPSANHRLSEGSFVLQQPGPLTGLSGKSPCILILTSPILVLPGLGIPSGWLKKYGASIYCWLRSGVRNRSGVTGTRWSALLQYETLSGLSHCWQIPLGLDISDVIWGS